jgi:hypothetical protein
MFQKPAVHQAQAKRYTNACISTDQHGWPSTSRFCFLFFCQPSTLSHVLRVDVPLAQVTGGGYGQGFQVANDVTGGGETLGRLATAFLLIT